MSTLKVRSSWTIDCQVLITYMIVIQYSSCTLLSVSFCVLVLVHELMNVTERVVLIGEREREHGCECAWTGREMVHSLFCWDL